MIKKPVILFDVGGFFQPMLEMIKNASLAGFIKSEHVSVAQRAETVDNALTLATSSPPDTKPRWAEISQAHH